MCSYQKKAKQKSKQTKTKGIQGNYWKWWTWLLPWLWRRCQKFLPMSKVKLYILLVYNSLCISHTDQLSLTYWYFIYQFSSVAQSCPTLCDPMDCSTPGLPVHHQLPEFIQTNFHWISDAIQPSHPLSSPSPPTFNLSQHQRLFQWVNSLLQVATYWSFSCTISPFNEYSGLTSFRVDWLDLLAVQGTLRVFSNTEVQKHQFFGTQLCL